MLKADVGARLGNLRGQVDDIIRSPWFDGFDMNALLQKKLRAPWVPPARNPTDLSHFEGAEARMRHVNHPAVDCSAWDHEF